VTPATPRRGEIWLVDLSPARGSEQAGIRPALVVQNDVGNQFAATTTVAAITSTLKVYPVTVALKPGEGGLSKPSIVNLAQGLTIDKTRLQRRLGSLPTRRMEAVNGAMGLST